MSEHRYIAEQELVEDAFRLGVAIFNSGFHPTFVVGLWRGGSTVGIYVQECLQHLGIKTNHIALRTSYQGLSHYDEMVSDPKRHIRVHGTQYLLETLNVDDRLLIVDDVSGSGQTLQVLRDRLAKKLKRNLPADIRVATLYHKPQAHRVGPEPDYYLHQTDDWLVLPYELVGIEMDALQRHKPATAALLHPDRIVTRENIGRPAP
ncbi:MAG: phosphoribosyltransferase family protein [Pseudomonadota bacterium]